MPRSLPPLLAVALLVGLLGASGPAVAAEVPGPDSSGHSAPLEPEAVLVLTANDTDVVGDVVEGDESDDESATEPVDDGVTSVEDTTGTLTRELDEPDPLEGASLVDVHADADHSLTGSTALGVDDELASATATPTTADEESITAPAGAPDGPSDDSTDDDGLPPVGHPVGGAVVGGAALAAGVVGRSFVAGTDAVGGIEAATRAKAAGHHLVGKLRDALRPGVGLFGYQRYDDSNPLDHDGRAQLFEHVRAEPGIHLSALSAAAHIPLSTTRYHVRILEHEGLLRTEKRRGRRRYFPPDTDDVALASAMASAASATILGSLVRDGPASVSQLAQRLDRTPSTISHHLDRLEADGLVEREREGRAVVSRATPPVRTALGRQPPEDDESVEPRPVALSD
jgi:DNA-binding transcriptional ArsR family regulator